LVAEGRFVAGAFVPAIVVKEAELEAKVVHERAFLYQEENLLEGIQKNEERKKSSLEKAKEYDNPK
jgi:hypothetical protein